MAAPSHGTPPDKPSRARIFSYWLGGIDHTAADRAEADQIERLNPGVRRMLLANRAFAARTASWAVADTPVVQVIDLDAGFPGAEDIHSVVRHVRPGAKVAYVSSDPEVVDTWDARLGERTAGVTVAGADFTDPDAVLGHPALKGVIDWDAPVALLCTLALNMMAAARARRLAGDWVQRLALGSIVAFTVPRIDDPAMAAETAVAWTGTRGLNLSRKQFSNLFRGLELVPPGIAPASLLRPGWTSVPERTPGPAYVLAGIGIKR